MKVKFVKELYSSLGTFHEGDSYEIDFKSYIIENWIAQGFCEPVKKASKKDGDKS